MRNAGQQVVLYQGSLPEASSAALAARLLGHDTRPSEAAIKAELKTRVREALIAWTRSIARSWPYGISNN